MAEIQRLMGCLCFVRRPGASPYADLMAPSLWSDVAREFSRQCCGLLGQVCFDIFPIKPLPRLVSHPPQLWPFCFS